MIPSSNRFPIRAPIIIFTMKFLLSTVVAFAAAVLAKPILTNSNFDIVEGEPFTFTWDNAEGEVTLTLKNGDPGNLKDVLVITGKSAHCIP